MSRKIALVLSLTILAIVGCGAQKYQDLRSLMGDMYTATDAFIGGLEKAAGPDDVAASVNQFCDRLEPLAPRIKEMKTKYPEFYSKGGDFPEELKDLKEKHEAQGERMKNVSMKLAQHMMNQNVMKAFQRLGSISMKMQ